jgi:putative phosphoesterase
MKIGIIFDTHDNLKNLGKALAQLEERGSKIVIHCGDLVSPFMFKELAKFDGEAHIVFSYQDIGSLVNLVKDDKAITNFKNLIIHDEFRELEIKGKKIAFVHNDKLAELLAKTDRHSAVFYGHNHEAKIEKINNTLLVNPGELAGVKADKLSFAIYDAETNEAKLVELI